MRGEDSSVILDGRCNSKFNLIFHSFLFCQNHHTKKNLLQLIDLHLKVKMSLFPWWKWINLSHGKCHLNFHLTHIFISLPTLIIQLWFIPLTDTYIHTLIHLSSFSHHYQYLQFITSDLDGALFIS